MAAVSEFHEPVAVVCQHRPDRTRLGCSFRSRPPARRATPDRLPQMRKCTLSDPVGSGVRHAAPVFCGGESRVPRPPSPSSRACPGPRAVGAIEAGRQASAAVRGRPIARLRRPLPGPRGRKSTLSESRLPRLSHNQQSVLASLLATQPERAAPPAPVHLLAPRLSNTPDTELEYRFNANPALLQHYNVLRSF